VASQKLKDCSGYLEFFFSPTLKFPSRFPHVNAGRSGAHPHLAQLWILMRSIFSPPQLHTTAEYTTLNTPLSYEFIQLCPTFLYSFLPLLPPQHNQSLGQHLLVTYVHLICHPHAIIPNPSQLHEHDRPGNHVDCSTSPTDSPKLDSTNQDSQGDSSMYTLQR
jgi:hypothetical protein